MVNETGLWRLIDECIRNMKLQPFQVDFQARCVDIVSSEHTIDLEQDTWVLVSSELDVPYTAQIILASGNMMMETSKSDYEKQSYAQYQFFRNRLTVVTKNYGIRFIPYRLEFIRISPNVDIDETVRASITDQAEQP